MVTDEQAFTTLYRRHYADVERYARRRLADDAVRDAVADVFLVAWRRFADIPQDAVLPWLYGVARNVVANTARGSRRARSLRERVELERVELSPDPAADVVAQVALAEVFDALSPSSQEILRLVAWEGLSIAEAARAAGCGVAAATMRLHRARRQARRALERLDSPRQPSPILTEEAKS